MSAYIGGWMSRIGSMECDAADEKVHAMKTMGRHELLMDIAEYGNKILNYVEGKSAESLIGDNLLFAAILYRLKVVADVTKRLLITDPEIKRVSPEVPWDTMSALSDHIVHEYNLVDPTAIFALISSEGFRDLIKLAHQLLSERD